MGDDRFARPARQAGEQAEGKIRRGKHLVQPELKDERQPLPSIFRIRRQGRPAGRREIAPGLGKAVRRLHQPVDKAAALLIAMAIERVQPVGAHAPGFLQHRHRQIGIHFLADVRHRLVETKHLRQQETIIGDRRNIAEH